MMTLTSLVSPTQHLWVGLRVGGSGVQPVLGDYPQSVACLLGSREHMTSTEKFLYGYREAHLCPVPWLYSQRP